MLHDLYFSVLTITTNICACNVHIPLLTIEPTIHQGDIKLKALGMKYDAGNAKKEDLHADEGRKQPRDQEGK